MAQEGIKLRGLAHHRHAARAVLGSDLKPAAESGDGFGHFLCRGLHGGHRPPSAQFLQGRAAPVDHLQRLIERERPARTGCGNLAPGMAHDGGRLQPPRLQRPDQRHLIGEQKRLGHLCIAQLLFKVARPHPRDDRPARHRPIGAVDPPQTPRIGRITRHRHQTHAGVLRPIAGEHECRRGIAQRGASRHKARVAVAGRPADQGRRRRFGLIADHRGALGKAPAIGRSLGTQLAQARTARLGGDEGLPVAHGPAQRLFSRRAQEQDRCIRATRRQGRTRRWLHAFKDGMGIGPAEPEGTDPGEKRPAVQRHMILRYGEVQVGKGDARVQFGDVQGGGKLPPLHRDKRLQKTRHTGCRFQMPDIRLHRSDRQGGGARLPEHAAQRRRLYGIPCKRAGSMRLDKGKRGGINPAAIIDPAQERRLTFDRRQGHVQRAPIGIRLHPDQRRMGAAWPQRGGGLAFQNKGDRAFGPHIPIGPRRERLAAPYR